MSVGRLIAVCFPLFVVGCSVLIPFDDYDSQYEVRAPDSGTPDSKASGAPVCPGVDTKTDGHHCGSCEHDCNGAECHDGVCDAQVIVSDPAIAFESLAQDEIWLYGAGSFAGGTGIARLKKADPKDVHPLAYASSPAHFLVARGADLYWTEDRGLGHIVKPADNAADPSKGDTTEPFFLSVNPPDGLAVDDNFVYWTQAQIGRINRARRDTTDPTTIANVVGALSAGSIASDSKFVFWADRISQRLIRSKTDGSDLHEIVVAQTEPAGLWVDDSGVYFTTRTAPGTVKRAAKDGSGLVVLAAAEPTPPDHVVVSGEWVYWIDLANVPGNGAVRRARRDGTEAITLAANQSPIDLVVDDTYVYWSSIAEHAIKRVAK